MKKIILAIGVVCFFSFPMEGQEDLKKIDEEQDCLERAWDYGTRHGRGNSYSEWYWTNYYYERNCI
tara:strand:+ start:327 stop:524 length:198 start_codon:yes stop_codon:yes gene_type:complete